MKAFILIEDNTLSVVRDADGVRLPCVGEVRIIREDEAYRFGGYVACGIRDTESLSGEFDKIGVREAWNVLPGKDYAAVVKGAELVHWNESERFCCHDGSHLSRGGEISKVCPECGREYFPRLNPAIVVLVKRGDEALLVHSRNFRNGMMALVAGFVETGESLEECVRREIKEETTLDVSDIRYVGSQSWPFPHQLMVGFTANYSGGSVDFADKELTAGGFFTRDSVPQLPTLPSLSRRIIDLWISGEI